MRNTRYRVQRTIDIELTTDGDGDFGSDEITGLSSGFVTPEDVREAGYSVTRVAVPEHETDPVGTVRVFRLSANRVVKASDGKWYYYRFTTPASAENCTGPNNEYIPNEHYENTWTDLTVKDAL